MNSLIPILQNECKLSLESDGYTFHDSCIGVPAGKYRPYTEATVEERMVNGKMAFFMVLKEMDYLDLYNQIKRNNV